jgi:NRPS condensation-like uncharacterized protein
MTHRGSFPASVQDWFFVAISFGHDQTTRLVAELDGRVDHPRLVRALGLLYGVEPITRSRLVEGFFRAAWEPRDDLDPSEACLLIPSQDPVRDVHDYMAAPIDPRREPVAQVRVFRSARDTVCFKMSHVAMDGAGLKQVVQKLTAIYRSLGLEGGLPALPPVAVERRQSTALRPFTVLTRLRAFVTQPFHEKRWRFPYLAGTPSDITFSERTARITVPQLKESVRLRGATMTDALIASFARAVFQETETPSRVPLPFTVTVDLRRFVPDPGVLGACNLSSLAWIEIPHEPGAGRETTLAQVHDRFSAVLADAPGVGLAMVMHIVSVLGYRLFVAGNRLRIRMAQREGREFPSLSNVGAIDNRVFDFGDARMVRARVYGSVMYPPTFYVLAGSFEDSLYFTIAYPRSLVPGNLTEAILDRAVTELDSLRLPPRP